MNLRAETLGRACRQRDSSAEILALYLREFEVSPGHLHPGVCSRYQNAGIAMVRDID